MEDHTYYKYSDGEFREIPSSEDLIKYIKNKLEDDQYLINHWKNLYEESVSASYKDTELSKLKKKVEDCRFLMSHGFNITPTEVDAINNWRMQNSITEIVTYIFTPTSLGTGGKVTDNNGHEFIFREIE